MPSDIKISKHQQIFFLACLSIVIAGSSVDMFVPSLPAIGQHFQVSAKTIGLIVTFYLLAYGVAQIFVGSLSDSFGRRKILVSSMFAFAITTAVIPLCSNINALLFLRALQGLFAAGFAVSSRALLSDCYSGQMLAKRASYYTLSWSIGAILSPFMGGYLQVHFGWHASFYCLAAYTLLIAILSVYFLLETSPHKHRFRLQVMAANYKTVLSSKLFFYATFACGLSYGLIASFNVSGPFLIETVLQFNAIVYGHIALLLGISWMLGNLSCRFLVTNKQANFYFTMLAIFAVFIALTSLFISLATEMTLWSVSLPTILLFYCGGVFFPLGFGKGLSYFPKIIGSASAIMGAVYAIMAGTISGIASFAKANTATNLSIIFVTSAILITLFLFLLLKPTPQIEPNEPDLIQ